MKNLRKIFVISYTFYFIELITFYGNLKLKKSNKEKYLNINFIYIKNECIPF